MLFALREVYADVLVAQPFEGKCDAHPVSRGAAPITIKSHHRLLLIRASRPRFTQGCRATIGNALAVLPPRPCPPHYRTSAPRPPPSPPSIPPCAPACPSSYAGSGGAR